MKTHLIPEVGPNGQEHSDGEPGAEHGHGRLIIGARGARGVGRLGLLGHLLVPPPHQLRVRPRGRLRFGVISQGRQALQTGDQAVAGEGGAEADDEEPVSYTHLTLPTKA